MKKLLSAVLLLAFAACGAQNKDKGEDTNDTTINAQLPSDESSEMRDEMLLNDSNASRLTTLNTQLQSTFKVEGTPNIEKFIRALPLFDKEFEWDSCAEIDKKNGYFYYFEEGDGAFEVYGALWNRKDDKKLFIVSYRQSELKPFKGHTEPFCISGDSKWYYISADRWGNELSEEEFIECESGFMAYLYNPTTKKLEPLPEPPFKNWANSTSHRLLHLPQKGKDIEVKEYQLGSEDPKEYILRWNGMTFE